MICNTRQIHTILAKTYGRMFTSDPQHIATALYNGFTRAGFSVSELTNIPPKIPDLCIMLSILRILISTNVQCKNHKSQLLNSYIHLVPPNHTCLTHTHTHCWSIMYLCDLKYKTNYKQQEQQNLQCVCACAHAN